MIAYLIALTSHSLSHYYSQVHLIIECFLAVLVYMRCLKQKVCMYMYFVFVYCLCDGQTSLNIGTR